MKTIFSHLWGLYFYPARLILFLLSYMLARPYLENEKAYPEAHRWRKLGSGMLLKAGGMQVECRNRDDIDWNRHYIICANHTSSLDIILMNKIIPGTLSFMGKADLSELPFMGHYLKTIDIAVERENATAAGKAFIKAIQAVGKDRHLVIFPEGGIFHDPKTLSPFKDGAFQIAARKGIPVLPVTILDAWRLLPDKNFRALPGKIVCVFHPPVEGMKDAEEMKQRVFELVQKPLKEYYDETAMRKSSHTGG